MGGTCCGLRTWVAGFALLALVGVLSFSLGAKDHALAQTPANPLGVSSKAEHGMSYARSLSTVFREVAQKVLPAVVTIENRPAHTEQAQDENEDNQPFAESPFGDMLPPEFRHFFRMPHGMPHREVHDVGSGMIIDPSGIILTNNHVVEGGGKITVILHDGREFEATDVKRDPKADLAIVRIKDGSSLPSVKLGNSDDMQVGDWVLALGVPFKLEGTVTAGIVSAKGRGLDRSVHANFIQTDAAINPGNSGGPLVNLDGEVIGINTAITSATGGYQGVGFAISSNLAKWVSQQLIGQGTVRRAYLGVAIQQVSHELAKQFGVQTQHGVVVDEVQPNTPAAAAGLKSGDVILEFSGKLVNSPLDLQVAVEQSPIGTAQPLAVMRNGKRLALEVTVREQPANYGSVKRSKVPSSSGTMQDEKLGIDVGGLTPEVAEKLGVKSGEGVVITDVHNGSRADSAGLTTGMVIAQVGRQPIKSVSDFRAAMEKQSLEKGILLLIRSSEGTRFVVIQAR
jgi:serine protease Do